jgi:hypothetical protein
MQDPRDSTNGRAIRQDKTGICSWRPVGVWACKRLITRGLYQARPGQDKVGSAAVQSGINMPLAASSKQAEKRKAFFFSPPLTQTNHGKLNAYRGGGEEA